MNSKDLLDATVARGASDLHLNPGRPPVLRCDGRLVELEGSSLNAAATEALCRGLCPADSWKELEAVGSTDFGLAHEDGSRFRVSVFRQRQGIAAVARLIPDRLLGLDEIGLPESCQKLLRAPRGLVLVTGPTGSGKSTSLAAMVDWINANMDRHIITIEDPVEYYHSHKRGLVTQRELGPDVPNFPEALRRALRQDPDVILLGEMRDLDTISAAITAAETGHLVFGTLHTTGSARTVDRMIDAFPAGQQDQIRAQLSVSLLAVISQVLVPATGGSGRVAGFEVLLMNAAIANLVRKGETNKILSTIQTSRRFGMVSLDDYLLDLVRSGKVEREGAMDAAFDRADLETRLGG